MDEIRKKRVLKKIMGTRLWLIETYPFYTRLLLRLNLGLAHCQTAYTDMKRVVFDPYFVERISDEEVRFVLYHELLHCVLGHCVRGKNYNQKIYNISCDIVVNSNILQVFKKKTFLVDKTEAMHLAPNGQEGYLYTAEEVYKMLMDACDNGDDLEELAGLKTDLQTDGDRIDEHPWEQVEETSMQADDFQMEVERMCGRLDHSFPPSVRQLAKEYHYKKSIAWKSELRKFVRRFENNFDYNFLPPDRRFQNGDIFMPGYNAVEGECTNHIWFLVDTSASVGNQQLKAAFDELERAISQVPGLEGMLSFFDVRVSKPQKFQTVQELRTIEPVGGGGTSFRAIFEYLNVNETFKKDPPAAIVIFTDGYAEFPPKESAKGIPVVWIIVDIFSDDIRPPWGRCIHIKNERYDKK